MTKEEFEKFKMLLARMKKNNLIEFTINNEVDPPEYNVISEIFNEENLQEKMDLLGEISVKDFLWYMDEAKDYDELKDEIKSSNADVDRNIQKVVNIVKNFSNKELDKGEEGRPVEMDDLYAADAGDMFFSFNRGKANSLNDKKKLAEFLDKLKNAKTFTNSPEYIAVIDKVSETLNTIKTKKWDWDNYEDLNAYSKLMDELVIATDNYVEHKVRDGIKENAYDKVSVCAEIREFAGINNSKVLLNKIEMNKSWKGPEEKPMNNATRRFKSNMGEIGESLKGIYADKWRTIEFVMSSFESAAQRVQINYDWEFSMNDRALVMVGNLLATELMYSNGNGTALTDAIFKDEKPESVINQMAEWLENSYPGFISSYDDENKLTAMMSDPGQLIKDASESKIYLKPLIELSSDSPFYEGGFAEKLNLNQLENEGAEPPKKTYSGSFKDTNIWMYMASKADSKEKQKTYLKKAKAGVRKACFEDTAPGIKKGLTKKAVSKDTGKVKDDLSK